MCKNVRTAAIMLGLCLILMVVNSGCTKPDTTSQVGTYARDGRLGTTRSNPNLATSPTYHNYRADTQLMKSTLRRIPGIRKSTILLNGPNAHITLYLVDGASPEQAGKIEQDAQRIVASEMPRYNIFVRVAQNYR